MKRPNRKPSPRRSRAAGFTLLEVLVALLVVSFGMLGVAGLQLLTLKNNVGSKNRSVAIQLAADLSERMRSNITISAQNAPAVGTGYNRPANSGSDAMYNAPEAACSTAAGCNADALAATDVAQWQEQIRRALPGGVGIVCIDSGTLPRASFDGTTVQPNCDGIGRLYAVKIFWLDDRSNATTGNTDQRAWQLFETRFATML